MSNAGRFKPGQSGNPGGRPGIPKDVRELLKERTPECFNKLWDLICNANSETAKLRAIEVWLDRSLGKPIQHTTHEDQTEKLTQERLEKAGKMLKELKKGAA